MKCQKCSKPAVVHLTEVVSDPMGAKRAVEIHLCLGHAAEAGLIAPGSEILPQVMSMKPASKKPEPSKASGAESPTSIVPSPPKESGLVVARDKSQAADP